ncbi:Oidioi.mRNA.OKI2018_I69.PAR.g12856.t1.cds [Oikopleura dioica]|uniref:Oidioi.mRNA.OKI2018_I69.PAR.g12856.t1.cds n=1 Tax=Oikopleura dioica TaxID=34765 RepID=A0ABN7S214_OIKDI|nr:Oidioi.mRNA.OKI2018_I69.PAR.g12856.t1.cds [Oikopleura dioica]
MTQTSKKRSSDEGEDGDYRSLKYFGNIPEEKRYDYVSLSLETADTFGQEKVLVRATVVNAHGRTVLDEFCMPQSKYIIDMRTWHHGIKVEEIQDEQWEEELIDKVRELLRNKIVVGFNLEPYLKVLGVTKYTFTLGLEAPTLTDLADEHLDMDYPAEDHHDSIEEARTVMKIFAKDFDKWENSKETLEEEEAKRKKNFSQEVKKEAYYYCKYCDVAMNSRDQEDAHLDGKKHRKKRKQYNKLHGIKDYSPPPRRKKVTPPRYDSRSRSRSRSYSSSSSRSRSRGRTRGRYRSRSRSYSSSRSRSSSRGRSKDRVYEEYRKERKEVAKDTGKPQYNKFGERINTRGSSPAPSMIENMGGATPAVHRSRTPKRSRSRSRTPRRKTPPRKEKSRRKRRYVSSSSSESEESESSEESMASDDSMDTIYNRKRYSKKKKAKAKKQEESSEESFASDDSNDTIYNRKRYAKKKKSKKSRR